MQRFDKDRLLDVCAKHTRHPDDGVVISEAYLPYIPDNWNGFLVLAESQNLSNKNDKYVQELENLEPHGRMTRLKSGSTVGVGPWDDGSLKLALESAFSEDSTRTAVSNAIPWARRDDTGSNANPTAEMIAWAADFWVDLLPLIQPRQIIVAGKMAMTVLDRADRNKTYCRTHLRLPSPQAMSRISGMFQKDDLLARYPEVCGVVERHPDWGATLNHVFFACHAVSSVAGVHGQVR